MKFLVKIVFLGAVIFFGAYNAALFFATCFLLFSSKISGFFWWPREMFLVSPFMFILVLGMSYFGVVLSVSILLNFKEKNGSIFKNVGKYLLCFLLAIGGALSLLYELKRIGHALPSIWEMEEGGLVSSLGLRKFALFFPLMIAGLYGWFFSGEKRLNIVVLRGKSQLNKFLLLSVPLVLIFFGLFWIVGYFQSGYVNPGSGQAEKRAGFNFYGLENNERYYWIGIINYDEKKQEIWGKIAPKNNSHPPLVVRQRKSAGANWEKILKTAQKKSLVIKEYNSGKEVFRGYEEIESDQKQQGEFLWQINKQTDMLVAGTMPVYLGWQRVMRDLAANFEK